MAFIITATPTITGGTCTAITISWTGGAGQPGYLYRNGSIIWSSSGDLGASGSASGGSIVIGTTYSYYIYQISQTSNTATITPYSLNPPTLSSASYGGSSISFTWTYTGTTPTSLNLYRRVDGGSWASYDTPSPSHALYEDFSVSGGHTYDYKMTATLSGGYGTSGYSNVTSCVTNSTYTDTVTDYLTVGEAVSDHFATTDVMYDVLGMLESVSDRANYTTTVTDNLTLSDYISSAQSLKTDFTYYLGTESGAIYEYSQDYEYDDSALSGTSVPIPIVSTWWSKAIDFVEDDVENTGRWKTIYRIEFLYREWGTIPVNFSISSDGGATWENSARNIGTSSNGRTEHAHFHFVTTGQFFVFKVEWSSATVGFQFLGFDVIYQEGPEQFEVTP